MYRMTRLLASRLTALVRRPATATPVRRIAGPRCAWRRARTGGRRAVCSAARWPAASRHNPRPAPGGAPAVAPPTGGRVEGASSTQPASEPAPAMASRSSQGGGVTFASGAAGTTADAGGSASPTPALRQSFSNLAPDSGDLPLVTIDAIDPVGAEYRALDPDTFQGHTTSGAFRIERTG